MWKLKLIRIVLIASSTLRVSGKVVIGHEKIGEVCEFEDGVLGRCEETSSCRKHGGVTSRNGVVKLCDGPLDSNTCVCCRRPYDVAREICGNWNYFWRDELRRCRFEKPLLREGEEAEVGQFPEVVLIGKKRGRRIKWICGGTLVSPHFVLTAAHCVFQKGNYMARFGAHELNYYGNGTLPRILGPIPVGLYGEVDLHYEKRRIVEAEQLVTDVDFYIFPGYKGKRYHDIALIKLKRPVVFTERVLPACLPVDEDKFMNLLLTVAGWGMKSFHSPGLAMTLKRTQIPVINSIECSSELRRKDTFIIPKGILKKQLCAGEEGKTVCNGDSGSPLVLQRRERHTSSVCEHTVAGIVSFAYGCEKINVYTRVSSYLDWITGIIAPKLLPNHYHDCNI